MSWLTGHLALIEILIEYRGSNVRHESKILACHEESDVKYER